MKITSRTIRINELLKVELGNLIEKYLEHKQDCLLSVTEVQITPDLRQAKVYVSVLGNDENKKEVLKALYRKRVFFQRLISKNIMLKYTPILDFQIDTRIEAGDKVLAILEELEKNEKHKI